MTQAGRPARHIYVALAHCRANSVLPASERPAEGIRRPGVRSCQEVTLRPVCGCSSGLVPFKPLDPLSTGGRIQKLGSWSGGCETQWGPLTRSSSALRWPVGNSWGQGDCLWPCLQSLSGSGAIVCILCVAPLSGAPGVCTVLGVCVYFFNALAR